MPLNNLPEKEILEQQKLALEIEQLTYEKRRRGFKFFLSLIPTIVLLLGVGFTFNEFILNDRTFKNNQKEATLSFLNTRKANHVEAAYDSLVSFTQHAIKLSKLASNQQVTLKHLIGNDSIIKLNKKLLEDIKPLYRFYNDAITGVQSDYFDKDMIVNYLENDLEDIMSKLSILQNHTGKPKASPTFSYGQFRSMIDFYNDTVVQDDGEDKKYEVLY